MELNRTNSPNCSRLVSSSITAGGTLVVTNLGPVLQPGDSFQLFSTPVLASFASVSLPTNDPVTLAAYTWTNRLAIDGTIAVLAVIGPVNPNPIGFSYQGEERLTGVVPFVLGIVVLYLLFNEKAHDFFERE